jgi:uncharacterized membrane protein
MSHLYLFLKFVHILGGAVLFGTGLGIAYFMFMAHRTGEPAAIAHTARIVVLADALFTATAVVVQPLTGWAMMLLSGFSLYHVWIKATLVLYVLVGLCWLPVVWIQWRMRELAAAAAREGRPLPARYQTYFKVWFWLGWPAFSGVIAIFALMIWKPHW